MDILYRRQEMCHIYRKGETRHQRQHSVKTTCSTRQI